MSTASTHPVPRPLRLVSDSSSPVPSSASPSAGPLSAPLRMGVGDFDVAKPKSNPRRQSSICYNTASVRGKPGVLGRSNSIGATVVLNTAKEPVRSDERHSPVLPSTHDHEPVTLAEKHADLLRFIAQKESKCLELRTQLAQHEADLLLLKRKWERIVSKGSPASGGGSGIDMLDGIREGVQSGLGRVFAVLEPPLPISPTPTLGQQARARNKRASVSSNARSSTGSSTSASSLFDDLTSRDLSSAVSSVAGESADTDTTRSPVAFKRASVSFAQPQASEHIDDDPSAKRRRQRPVSVNFSQQSLPLLSPPLGKHMSMWVPDLNKRWEELKGSETLSKQSKRASVLLNDVLTALAPPAPIPASKYAAKRPSPSPSPSLLDEDDECTAAGDVLTPEIKIPAPDERKTKTKAPDERMKDDAEADEWNW